MTSCNLPYFAKEHEEMRTKVGEFAREVVAPVARRHDADATFPWATVKQMADLGLLGIPWPAALGGSVARRDVVHHRDPRARESRRVALDHHLGAHDASAHRRS